MAVMDVPVPLRWDRLDPAHTVVQADTPLPHSPVAIRGTLGEDGTVLLEVGGAVVATGHADGALSIYPAGILEAGQFTQTRYPAVGKASPSAAFPGSIEDIRVSFGRAGP